MKSISLITAQSKKSSAFPLFYSSFKRETQGPPKLQGPFCLWLKIPFRDRRTRENHGMPASQRSCEKVPQRESDTASWVLLWYFPGPPSVYLLTCKCRQDLYGWKSFRFSAILERVQWQLLMCWCSPRHCVTGNDVRTAVCLQPLELRYKVDL